MTTKKDGRSYSDGKLEALRMRAIEAYRQGQTVSDIARLQGLNRGSVTRWIARWRLGGKAALRRSVAIGRPPKLDCEKHGRQILSIVKRSATEHGYETPRWTYQRIKDTLKRELKLNVSVSTVWRVMKELNLSTKKPQPRTVGAVGRKARVEKSLPKIRSLARK